jgi:hypothetical protein
MPTMTQKEAKEIRAKHPTIAAAARSCGMPESTFTDVLRGKYRTDNKAGCSGKSTPATAPRLGVKSLADFRQTYDRSFIIPGKIRAALKALGSGGWEYEVDFCKRAGVSPHDLSTYREPFSDYFVSLGREGRRAWAGSPGMARAMKEMLP